MSKSNQDVIAELNVKIAALRGEKADLEYKLRNAEYSLKASQTEATSLKTEIRVAQAKTEQSEKLFSILTAKPAQNGQAQIWNTAVLRDPRF